MEPFNSILGRIPHIMSHLALVSLIWFPVFITLFSWGSVSETTSESNKIPKTHTLKGRILWVSMKLNNYCNPMWLYGKYKFGSIFFCHYVYYNNLKFRPFETMLILYFLNRKKMISNYIKIDMKLNYALEHLRKMCKILQAFPHSSRAY